MKKSFLALIMVIVFGSSTLSAAAGLTQAKPAIPKGSVVLQKANADVTGDAVKDSIVLMGQKYDSKSLYFKSIFLLVNNMVVNLSKDYDGGMEPKFILKDFNGDKIPDIFLSSATGGSGGIMYYHIFTLKGGKPKLIFSPTPDSALIIKGAYQDNYKVKMTIAQTKQAYTFDYSDRKSDYGDSGLELYKNGKLLKKADINTDYYGILTPQDTDKDGVFELQGTQAVWGIVHADTLAIAKSTWKWTNNSWKVVKATITQIRNDSAQRNLLSDIMQLAKKGKIINCEYPVKTTVVEDVEKKWGKPDKTEWIPAAKGTYVTFSKKNVVFGFNKGSQIFEARTFDKSLKGISLSLAKQVLGKPAYDVNTRGEEIIGYVAGPDYKVLLVFPQPSKEKPDPFMDHYSVLYPKGTVNLMADDPGRQW